MKKIFITALLLVGLVAPVEAAVIYDFDDTGASTRDNFTGTVGGRFVTQTTGTITVASLGFIDTDGILAIDHQVGLWTNSGTLLASVTVPAGTAAPLVDGFRWVDLAVPISLTNGTAYRIGAEVVSGSGDPWYNHDQGTITLNPALIATVNGANQAAFTGGSGLNFPSGITGSSFNLFVAANLSDVAMVPEPSSLMLLGLGLVGMTGFGRRRK